MNWRLPADTDLHALRDEIESAMLQGRTTVVKVEMHDDPRTIGEVILNGRVLTSAAAVELPET
jgi:hypothetical protein